MRRAASEVCLIAVIARERWLREWQLDVIVTFAASVFILVCVHYGAMRARP